MFYAKIARSALVAAAMLTASFSSFAQTGTSAEFEEILVKTFASFAGSTENAQSLVSGLRSGTQLTLQPAVPGCAPPPPPPVLPPFSGGLPGGLPGFPPPPPPPASAPVLPASFTPPTGNMGYGNVNIAMDLAQQQLAKAGITRPTPVQIRASFMGGPVTTCAGVTTQLEGILVLRAGKEGWGRIAARLGLVSPG